MLIRKFTIPLPLAILLGTCVPSFASNWQLIDEPHTYTSNMAQICHFWSATIFAPGEKGSCNIGTIYVVDINEQKIYYSKDIFQGYPTDKRDLRTNRETLIYALENGDGYQKLDSIRERQLQNENEARIQQEAETAKLASEEATKIYRNAFESALTLPLIYDFEAKYATSDTEGLIPRLSVRKAQLERNEYLKSYAEIDTLEKATSFIKKYGTNDPDGLILQAKKRAAVFFKQQEEQRLVALKQDRIEKEKKEASERQLAADAKKNRLQYIAELQRKYSGNLKFGSPDAMGTVMTFDIQCPNEEGRYLPLKNLIYAQMAQVDHMGGTAKVFADSRGKEVRIYQMLYKGTEKLGEPRLTFEIDAWGDLRPVGITKSAVLMTCYGSAGPIWKTARD